MRRAVSVAAGAVLGIALAVVVVGDLLYVVDPADFLFHDWRLES